MTLPFFIWQGAGLWIWRGDVTLNNCEIHHNTAAGVSAFRTFPEPSSITPLDENSLTSPLILQGGGLVIGGGTVTMTACQIYSNTANNVSSRLLNLP